MGKKPYQISEEFFNDKINPLIVGSYSQAFNKTSNIFSDSF